MVPLGLVLGAIAAGAILFSLGAEHLTHAVHNREGLDFEAMIELGRQAGALASVVSIVPALLLVVIGEVGRIRSSVYYILGGGAVLAAMPLLARVGTLSVDLSPLGTIWQIFATAGFAGGFVYWLVAGRKA
jgi:hypothetical protein